MTTGVRRTAIVIGIGNTFMGDDGIGPVVARLLSERAPADCEVIVGETAGMALLSHFLEGVPVIVVDGLAAGAEPGTVFRFRPDEAGILELRSNTLHGCGLPYLVTSARLRGVEPDVTVYGIQVGDVRPRPDTLTTPVGEAAVHVADLIRQHVAALRRGTTVGSVPGRDSAAPIGCGTAPGAIGMGDQT